MTGCCTCRQHCIATTEEDLYSTMPQPCENEHCLELYSTGHMEKKAVWGSTLEMGLLSNVLQSLHERRTSRSINFPDFMHAPSTRRILTQAMP